MNRFHFWSSWLALAIVLVVSGVFYINYEFVHESHLGDAFHFSYQPWMLICLIMGCIILVRIGWLWSKEDEKFGVLILAGIGLAAFSGPTFYLNMATLTKSGFSLKDGIWASIERDVQFADLERLRLLWHEEYRTRRRGRGSWVTVYSLHCETIDGQTNIIEVSNPLTKVLMRHVLAAAEEHDIPISKPVGKEIEHWFTKK